jgi:hypothetical protein
MSRPQTNREEVLKHFEYDRSAGALIWKLPTSMRVHEGDSAGCLNGHGRVVISFLGKGFFRAHLVWLLENGALPPDGLEVDHRDRDRKNDRIGNLRLATASQNRANSSRSSANNATRHKNIYMKGKKLIVRVIGAGRSVQKSFYTLEEAIRFRNIAVKEIHGEFGVIDVAHN